MAVVISPPLRRKLKHPRPSFVPPTFFRLIHQPHSASAENHLALCLDPSAEGHPQTKMTRSSSSTAPSALTALSRRTGTGRRALGPSPSSHPHRPSSTSRSHPSQSPNHHKRPWSKNSTPLCLIHNSSHSSAKSTHRLGPPILLMPPVNMHHHRQWTSSRLSSSPS